MKNGAQTCLDRVARCARGLHWRQARPRTRARRCAVLCAVEPDRSGRGRRVWPAVLLEKELHANR